MGDTGISGGSLLQLMDIETATELAENITELNIKTDFSEAFFPTTTIVPETVHRSTLQAMSHGSYKGGNKAYDGTETYITNAKRFENRIFNRSRNRVAKKARRINRRG